MRCDLRFLPFKFLTTFFMYCRPCRSNGWVLYRRSKLTKPTEGDY